MSDLSNFDDLAKKQLGDYSPEVPSYIWDNIVAKKEKKKPYPFFLQFFNRKNLLLTAGLIALLIVGFFTLNNYTENKSEQSKSQLISNKESETNSSNKKQQEVIQTETAVSHADDKAQKSGKNSQQAEEPGSKNNAGNINDPESASPEIFSSIKKEQDKSIIARNKGDRHFYKNAKVIIKNSKDDALQLDNENIPALKNVYAGIETDEAVLSSLLFYYPEIISANSVKGIELNTTMLPPMQTPPCPALENNAAGNKYYFEVYAGPDYASKKFSDTASSMLLQKRKESTSFRSAFSAGIRYTRVFENGASIRTGINYSQINEKFSYVQSNVVQVTYITDPATGDTTGTFLTRGTRYKTTNNRYHTLDVPLLLGFETGNGRLHANFNAGVVLNIYSWQKGESLDTSFKPVNISTGKSASLYQYKTNIGAGFMGSISVYYKLNERLHLLAEPYFRYNFSPMNKEMLSLQEKFTTIGLRLGIRMDLY